MTTEISVRPAGIEDGEFVWACRNDPAARAASRSTDAIPLDDHLRWFSARLESGATRFLIVTGKADERLGYVRFDRGPVETEISIALAPGARGKGVGTAAIRAASQLEAATEGREIAAYVRSDNLASLAAFRRAGYGRETIADKMHRLVYSTA